MKNLVFCFCAVVLLSQASMGTTLPDSSREKNKFGIYTGLLSDPIGVFPLSIAYNILPFLRLNAGGSYTYVHIFGDINIVTYGGGAKFLVPGWNFSPAVGINYTGGYGTYEDSGLFSYNSTTSTKGQKTTAGFSFGYANIGGDYQSEGGFNLGFGLNIAYHTSQDVDFPYPLPYFNLGFFF